ncbi:DUF4032 domain-containing protein [Corynebacterium vitaeruminis]|uniref:DUF4032 domain-containing protein n=1 Tax=Corynebacterium vitaeruminis TaxID=38305 RepID=UPI000A6341BF|nr:DUF4032 domain-containing protein [Corynebacterium vitaeruminis]
MPNSMSISTSAYAPALLTLPWTKPLDEWPQEIIVALPRGISRHVVRFVRIGEDRKVCAVKEIGRRVAHHEYRMLRELQRVGAPSVVPVAVITGRKDREGDELTAALVTEHLKFSLPYREIFSRDLPEDMAVKLIKALAILLVRLHLLNFYWGDVSLSNTLFRRDADTFSAYLVDAETGEFQDQLSDSRRLYDVDVARVNIIGELMDLQAGGYLSEGIDVIALGGQVESLYLELWEELTAEEEVDADEYWRVSKRINRLGELGFDVGEMNVTADDGSHSVVIRPVVVDAGHYHKELLRLTGLEVEEQQARRLLTAIREFRAASYAHDVGLAQAAHQWMLAEYEPTIAAMPKELVDKREPAQIFHEILDHRWYMTEKRQSFVPIEEAARSYYEKVLPVLRDEAVLIGED